MKLTVASVLALAAAVRADSGTDGPYSIGAAPAGFIKGVLNTTIACNITAIGFLPLGGYQIPFGVSAVLPDKVNANQPFNVVAGTRLIVPKSVNFLASLFGAKTYAGTATKVIVNAAGANPSSIDAAANGPLIIPNATINANGVSVLEVPGEGSTITVGPFVGASSTSTIVLSFGEIDATVKTYDKTGKATFVTATVKCPAAQRPTSLAFVNTGGSGSTTTINPKSDGSIQSVPLGFTAGVVGVNYNCDFSGYVKGVVRISVGGVASNAAVSSGGAITISQGQGNVYLTSSLIKGITNIVQPATSYQIDITTLNFFAKNASPAKLNVLPQGFTATAPLNTQPLVVPTGAPSNTLPDITFTAGASGTTALISLGDVAGSATLFDDNQNNLLQVDFTCSAPKPSTGLLPFNIA